MTQRIKVSDLFPSKLYCLRRVRSHHTSQMQSNAAVYTIGFPPSVQCSNSQRYHAIPHGSIAAHIETFQPSSQNQATVSGGTSPCCPNLSSEELIHSANLPTCLAPDRGKWCFRIVADAGL
ncbi:hypothetical protein CISG_02227 [Coccidioides immitis RMSCC 3703]|uniref:Uncharacterized protein n=1 Tax=Coccidioides immitis RMSCC 3703 TaxID=454286 RepID=A0A0J8R6B3_COCIT|nr:hypothetical protein CISG_02227 [Coccidioides immitis RMSCC 3703]